MYSEDGNCLLIFNGEIYNHLDLRSEFLDEIKFKSTSDTETLLYGLIKYGKNFINNLNGIFSFSFVDLESKEFLVVRDYFGVKPLYYYLTKKELFFSSESKVLIPFLKTRTINNKSIANYINFLWSPGEDTPLNEVKKFGEDKKKK